MKIILPNMLRKAAGGNSELLCTAETIGSMFAVLETTHPELTQRILDENKQVRKFVNIFVNGNDIRFLNGQETQVGYEDEVLIQPAVAGG